MLAEWYLQTSQVLLKLLTCIDIPCGPTFTADPIVKAVEDEIREVRNSFCKYVFQRYKEGWVLTLHAIFMKFSAPSHGTLFCKTVLCLCILCVTIFENIFSILSEKPGLAKNKQLRYFTVFMCKQQLLLYMVQSCEPWLKIYNFGRPANFFPFLVLS